MARLLLFTLLCLTVCFAAKIDHVKKKHSQSQAKTSPPGDNALGGNYDFSTASVDPNDIPPTDLPQDNNHGNDGSSDDFNEMTFNTDIGNDIGPNSPNVSPLKVPSPTKPNWAPKQPSEVSEDTDMVEGTLEPNKLPIKKKVSSAKNVKGVNFASAVLIMQTAQAGIDFPAFSNDNMPSTSFSCDQQNYPGYYADPEAQCQVFHYCPFKVEGMLTVAISFLCPNYTIFDQKTLSCNWFYQVDCNQAINLYGINSRLYQTVLPLIDDEPSDIGPHVPLSNKPKPQVSHKKPSKGKAKQ